MVKPAFNAIHLTVKSGVVTLQGTVGPDVHERALTLARGLLGTVSVTDELTVK